MSLLYRKGHYLKHPLKAIPAQIRWWWWGFCYGIRNVVRWFPTVWADDDCDFASLLEFMEVKLRAIGDFHDKHGHTMGAPRTARQTRMAAQLCRRIREEHYYWRYPGRLGDWCPPIGPWLHMNQHEMFDEKHRQHYDEYMMRQDLELLTTLIRKYLRHWWD